MVANNLKISGEQGTQVFVKILNELLEMFNITYTTIKITKKEFIVFI